MRIWSNEHVFNHPWETVIKAAVQKYPNPLNPSVLGVDVVDRRILPTGLIKSHRIFTTKWNLQPWAAKLLGGDRQAYASEHSVIDINKKTLTLRTRNLTFNNIINVDETCVYTEHPDDSEKTMFKQESIITVKNVPLTSYMESIISNSISSKSHQGRQAIEWVIKSMNDISVEAKTVTDKLQQSLMKEEKI
jgi:hypothetical protein